MKSAENPPMRPQRQIVRTNRETTGGLLMSVIRTLSSSRDLADRDRERTELRNGFNECDHKLNELISAHNNDLYQVMNIFSKVLNNLSKAKERLLSTREKLMNCQKLLHCKRSELNQLWFESVENRAQLSILEKVEYVISLPKVIDDAVSQKHYVHASQSCIEGLTMLTDPKDVPSNSQSTSTGVVSADNQVPGILSKIEALSEIRSELSKKKEALFERAIDDLHKHLYQISSAEVRKEFLRLNQGMDDNGQLVLSVEIGSTATNGHLPGTSDSGSGQLHSASFSIGQENDDPEASNIKTGCEVLVELTKCLVILNKVSDSMEQVRERCERELITIAIRSAQEILNTYSNGLSSTTAARNAFLAESKWNILDGSSGGSLLNDPSLTSDFPQNNSLLGSSLIGKPNTEMAVLSFSPLLGLCYDAYSHLPSMPTSNSNRSNERNPARRSAIMLKNFFTLLMTEFQRILSLHKETVLPTFKRLETSLYSQMEPDAFYTIDELSAKVQKLIVDLVACVCADSGRGGFPLLGNSLGLNGNDTGTGSGSGNSANGPGSASNALNGDLSSYFAKRRPLAGAMNAMNAAKNTMTAVANAAATAHATGDNQSNASASGGASGGQNQTNTNQLTASSGMVSSSSTHNFLSSVVGSTQRQNAAPIFKFSQSSQAISWNTYLAEQVREKEKEEDLKNDDKAKDGQELELAKGEPGRIGSNSGGSGSSGVSPSMINKLFDALKEIASPSLDNLAIVFGILFRNSDQIGADKNHLAVNLIHENIGEVAAKFAQQIRDQVSRVVDLSYKRLHDKSTLILFPQRSAYFENKLIEEAERSKLSKDESFQLMQQQQQLNSRLYPPLFTSVVIVDITARELEALMKAMPEYRDVYLDCICLLFTELKEQWNEVYRKFTTSHHSDGSISSSSDILSTNWCNDLDIMRTFKKLPNWEAMIDKQTRCYEFPLEMGDKRSSEEKDNSGTGPKLTGAEARRQYNLQAQLSSFDDSPEDIRLRNKRETEILTQNMLDKNREKIRLSQIFGHEECQFENLAQLQESADWMAARCEDVVERIYESSKDADMPDDVNIATLNQLVNDFREFAENCLILIHLEVRFHCFYYLQDLDQSFFTSQAPMIKSDGNDDKLGKGNARSSRRYDAMHEDRVINPLLDNLKLIHDELEKASLKPHKMHYIFEGLDSLIKTIFVNAVSNVNRVKPIGIKRALRAIFNIQKRLMSITKNAESRLDYCRKYFELLLTTPSEVLAQIIEKGQEFEYSEYRTAIVLLHNSKREEMLSTSNEHQIAPSLFEAELKKSLTQLDELLSKVSLNL